MSDTKNSNLHKAKSAKNDEFYTQYQDIEKEMQAYLEYDENVFRGKVILLPCDDPEWSNFTKYFAQNFERFGIKKLISTSYAPINKELGSDEQPSQLELNDKKYDKDKHQMKGKIFTISRDINNDKKIDINDLEWDYLEGDGDFRSEEVTNIAKEADFIITNPPFSLFREFLAWIVGMGKRFSIIGNKNAITYKEVFPLIKDNKIWSGSMPMGNDILFDVPKCIADSLVNKKEKGSAYHIINSKVMARASGMWFTNIEHGRRHEPLQLMTMADNLRYNKKVIKNKADKNTIYQKYDNYNAIEVGYTNAIPSDYGGVMGVPISFLDKYCPEQFDILGLSASAGYDEYIVGIPFLGEKDARAKINGKNVYARVFLVENRDK